MSSLQLPVKWNQFPVVLMAKCIVGMNRVDLGCILGFEVYRAFVISYPKI